MKTPKEYENNIKNKIITKSMLAECLFSVNKRAKNCRDKIADYESMKELNPYWTDKYDTIRKNSINMIEYYSFKTKMLTLLQPLCIHKNSFGEFFLFYEIDEYSFHSPIRYVDDIDDIKSEYPSLKVIDIVSLITKGEEISELISVQFVRKVIAIIESKDYTYKDDE